MHFLSMARQLLWCMQLLCVVRQLLCVGYSLNCKLISGPASFNGGWPGSPLVYLNTFPTSVTLLSVYAAGGWLQGCADAASLLEELPTKWEKLGDLALLPHDCMQSEQWRQYEPAVWRIIAQALGVNRLARQAPVANTGEHITGQQSKYGLLLYCSLATTVKLCN